MSSYNKFGAGSGSQGKSANPKVFFDVTIGGKAAGRMIFELYMDTVPKTATNFLELCKGGRKSRMGRPLHYKNSIFHRVIPKFMAQGGDFTRFNGTGGESIYGEKFRDENFIHKHTGRGILSMANAGPHTNGSQFFICFTATPHLNGKHVVFGRLVQGDDVLTRIERTPTDRNDRPIQEIKVVDCGEFVEKPKEEKKTQQQQQQQQQDKKQKAEAEAKSAKAAQEAKAAKDEKTSVAAALKHLEEKKKKEAEQQKATSELAKLKAQQEAKRLAEEAQKKKIAAMQALQGLEEEEDEEEEDEDEEEGVDEDVEIFGDEDEDAFAFEEDEDGDMRMLLQGFEEDEDQQEDEDEDLDGLRFWFGDEDEDEDEDEDLIAFDEDGELEAVEEESESEEENEGPATKRIKAIEDELSRVEQRVQDLRKKLEEARKENLKDRREESERLAKKDKRQSEREEEKDSKPGRAALLAHLQATASQLQAAKEKAAAKEKKTLTGSAVHSSEQRFQTFEKRAKELPAIKNTEKPELKVAATKPTPAQLEALKAKMEAEAKKKDEFSRRRPAYSGEEDLSINQSNKKFNEKMKKHYDKFTAPVKRSLERGTAE